jgi:putative transposase
MGAVIQAYRFALGPTPRQRRALASHRGAARYAHNRGLQLVLQRLEQRRAGEDVEVPWTLPALRREWNRAKHQVAPWWAENSKEAYSSGLDGLARRLEKGTARILAATISRTADRWYVSFTVEVQRTVPTHNGASSVIGVEVGVRHLAVLSTGEVVPNPHALQRSERRLRRLNRELARRRPHSQRRDQTRRKLARVHARAASLRRDALHKLTTTLATQHGTVVIEQLNVAGMIRNRRLARALADAGLAELRRQLTYKTSWYGSQLIAADRFYPSSKTCSACGWVKAKLTLAERTFACETCGPRLDRDLHAARNLAKLARQVARSGRETKTPVEPTISPSLLGRWP